MKQHTNAVAAAVMMAMAAVISLTTAAPAGASTSGCTSISSRDWSFSEPAYFHADNICAGYIGHWHVRWFLGSGIVSQYNTPDVYPIPSEFDYQSQLVDKVCVSGWRWEHGTVYTHMGTACDNV